MCCVYMCAYMLCTRVCYVSYVYVSFVYGTCWMLCFACVSGCVLTMFCVNVCMYVCVSYERSVKMKLVVGLFFSDF